MIGDIFIILGGVAFFVVPVVFLMLTIAFFCYMIAKVKQLKGGVKQK